MTDLPSINYVCSHCGATATYELVAEATHGPGAPPREIPSIDFRCLRCGANETYMLVPKNVPTYAT